MMMMMMMIRIENKLQVTRDLSRTSESVMNELLLGDTDYERLLYPECARK